MVSHSQPAPVPEPESEQIQEKRVEVVPAERKPRFSITIQGGIPI